MCIWTVEQLGPVVVFGSTQMGPGQTSGSGQFGHMSSIRGISPLGGGSAMLRRNLMGKRNKNPGSADK